MILLLAIVVAVLIGFLRGGSLRNLGLVQFRWAWLALLAVGTQLLLIRLGPALTEPARVLFPLTHLAIILVAWLNRDLAGMYLLAAGVALNLLVMVANGGFMPIAPEALVQAGMAESTEAVTLYTRRLASKGLVLPREETALWWLSDIIALRFPISTVISFGDVLIAVGLFLFVQKTMLRQEA